MSTRSTLYLKDEPEGFHLYEEVSQNTVEVEFSPGSVSFDVESVVKDLDGAKVHVPWLSVSLPGALLDKIAEIHAAKKFPHQQLQ